MESDKLEEGFNNEQSLSEQAKFSPKQMDDYTSQS